jgi:membrane protein YqaA with SNARE-associated domain
MPDADAVCELKTSEKLPNRAVPVVCVSSRLAAGLRVYWRLMLVVFVLALSIYIVAHRDILRQFASLGYPGIFLISLIGNATLILPAPSLIFVFAMGGVLDPLYVGLAAGAGEALGEMTGFLAGYGGGVVLEGHAFYDRVERVMKRYGLLPLFVLAVIPAGIFDVGGIVAGALHYPAWQFFLVTWLGKTIKCILVAYAGAGSIKIVDRWLPWME